MSLTGISEAVDKVNKETLPELEQILNRFREQLINDLHGVLDRLNKTTVTNVAEIPPRQP
jgi:hypothetical protein